METELFDEEKIVWEKEHPGLPWKEDLRKGKHPRQKLLEQRLSREELFDEEKLRGKKNIRANRGKKS